jgi:murein DD-endopeptidase MepM/ murein hydrolase activator NlpD
VRANLPDIRVDGAAYKRVGLVAALTLAMTLLGSGVAWAQSGGTPPPGGTTPPPPTTPTAPTGYTQVFPIPSNIAHTYGDGFGASRGKRSHAGQDIFAPCGSMLVSVSNGRVIYRGRQSSAGNYVVIRYKWLKQDYAYMHLQAGAAVLKGQKVTVGQYIGNVGDTGNARGCHLHFELWTGKWYRGGVAIDPLPALQLWDSYS